MNKSQFVDALSAKFEGNKKAAAEALDAVVDTITREVARGEKVVITGFGAFEKRVREARVVRNPQTGELIEAAKKAVPKFTPGADLRNVISGAKQLPAATVEAAGDAASGLVAKVTGRGSRKSSTPAPTETATDAAAATPATKAPATKAPAKKAPAKKAPAKKAPAKKAPAKKAPAKKAPAKKAPAKKAPATKATTSAASSTTAEKAPATKAPAKKAPATKATTKKTSATKAPAKKTPAKKTPAKKTSATTTADAPAPVAERAAETPGPREVERRRLTGAPPYLPPVVV
ncbi:HU family DNA-binding protein [Nocardioides zeae]|uniref:DNA-binding protein HU-beta n=1 Tax=Nocardioides zeae TaxID=1457234 RepID=A0AAJ1TVM0_9ACTN|nr:HU family DNA-binding protein [Nocardioides zeae]MDQ1103081.1 DNA-binding protein HU-beta [Nocardioides zeae]